ncbi:hypothetical protein Fcan01_25258 [Folsomia candida]|uniref:Uncharacterized protein n=1 Tax=Folsomia candida TaxID=158441 RepID=A0A226D563_FOLCA|nr:hypothetical protein Fcan01_25258 [Folsomia candida]
MNLYAGDIYFDLIIPTTVIIPATFGDFLVANVTIITTPFVSPGSKTDHIDTYEYLRLLKTKGMIAIMGAHKFVQNMHLGDGLQRIRYRSEPGAKGLIALLHVVALCSIVGLVATSILVCESLSGMKKLGRQDSEKN